MLTDETKLELLRIMGGQLPLAKDAAIWIEGKKPPDPFKDEVTLTRMEFLNNDPNSLILLLQAKFDALGAAQA